MQFEIHKNAQGQYYWFLQADNNRKIATSGESYWNKSDCEGGISLVKKIAPTAQFEISKNTQGQYYWTLSAANNRKIAYSGESYWNKSDCESAISLVKKNASNAQIIDNTVAPAYR